MDAFSEDYVMLKISRDKQGNIMYVTLERCYLLLSVWQLETTNERNKKMFRKLFAVGEKNNFFSCNTGL